MKQINIVKSLTFYNTTMKQNILMVGKGEQSDNYISNGSWLLQKKYISQKTIDKWTLVDTFHDGFINAHKNENTKRTFKVKHEDIQKFENIYYFKTGGNNLIIDNEVKERIIDVLAENEDITFVFYETPYLHQFVHVYDKGEFIGLLLVSRG